MYVRVCQQGATGMELSRGTASLCVSSAPSTVASGHQEEGVWTGISMRGGQGERGVGGGGERGGGGEFRSSGGGTSNGLKNIKMATDGCHLVIIWPSPLMVVTWLSCGPVHRLERLIAHHAATLG